ncbi:MAG: uncharacterized protein A8A55_2155 [Amphiamblys sp. WSBS2006]|nr:MAG: uncharacterized protein A8A55_2155 [Amphiamblys sp. WSBS2006]
MEETRAEQIVAALECAARKGRRRDEEIKEKLGEMGDEILNRTSVVKEGVMGRLVCVIGKIVFGDDGSGTAPPSIQRIGLTLLYRLVFISETVFETCGGLVVGFPSFIRQAEEDTALLGLKVFWEVARIHKREMSDFVPFLIDISTETLEAAQKNTGERFKLAAESIVYVGLIIGQVAENIAGLDRVLFAASGLLQASPGRLRTMETEREKDIFVMKSRAMRLLLEAGLLGEAKKSCSEGVQAGMEDLFFILEEKILGNEELVKDSIFIMRKYFSAQKKDAEKQRRVFAFCHRVKKMAVSNAILKDQVAGLFIDTANLHLCQLSTGEVEDAARYCGAVLHDGTMSQFTRTIALKLFSKIASDKYFGEAGVSYAMLFIQFFTNSIDGVFGRRAQTGLARLYEKRECSWKDVLFFLKTGIDEAIRLAGFFGSAVLERGDFVFLVSALFSKTLRVLCRVARRTQRDTQTDREDIREASKTVMGGVEELSSLISTEGVCFIVQRCVGQVAVLNKRKKDELGVLELFFGKEKHTAEVFDTILHCLFLTIEKKKKTLKEEKLVLCYLLYATRHKTMGDIAGRRAGEFLDIHLGRRSPSG